MPLSVAAGVTVGVFVAVGVGTPLSVAAGVTVGVLVAVTGVASVVAVTVAVEAGGPVGVSLAVGVLEGVSVAVGGDPVAVTVGVGENVGVPAGSSAHFTAATSSAISTTPSLFVSNASQSRSDRTPSAIVTPRISSAMSTLPFWSQSPLSADACTGRRIAVRKIRAARRIQFASGCCMSIRLGT
jgi:hypothetical protein